MSNYIACHRSFSTVRILHDTRKKLCRVLNSVEYIACRRPFSTCHATRSRSYAAFSTVSNTLHAAVPSQQCRITPHATFSSRKKLSRSQRRIHRPSQQCRINTTCHPFSSRKKLCRVLLSSVEYIVWRPAPSQVLLLKNHCLIFPLQKHRKTAYIPRAHVLFPTVPNAVLLL